MQSAREAARLEAGQNMGRSSKRGALSSPSASDESATEERLGVRRGVKNEGESRCGEVEEDERTKTRCREPDAGLDFARRVENSSVSGRTCGINARDTYSSEDFLLQ